MPPVRMTINNQRERFQPESTSVMRHPWVTLVSMGPDPDPSLDLELDQEAHVSADLMIRSFPRKEVIQPHLPVRLPCYDFTPVT